MPDNKVDAADIKEGDDVKLDLSPDEIATRKAEKETMMADQQRRVKRSNEREEAMKETVADPRNPSGTRLRR